MSLISGKYYPVGLDISDLTLKVAQVNKRGRSIRMQAMNRLSLEEGIIDGGEIKDRRKLLNSIRKLWKDPLLGSINSDKVVASLPDTKTFVKLLIVDKSPNDLSETIEAEIEKNVPYMINKVYYDWQIIEEGEDSYSVLVGACPKEISDDYYNLLTEAGFSVEALEIEAIALARALLEEEAPRKSKSKKKNNYLIVDLGKSRSTFVVYSQGAIIFTADIEVGGDDITQEIDEKLNLSYKEAEKKKVQHSKGGSSKSNIEVEKIIDQKFMEINKKINEIAGFYNNRYSDRGKIGKILLCGGGANYNNIESLITASNVDTQRGDPLIHLSDTKTEISKKIGKKKSYNRSLSYTTAIGLTLGKVFYK